MSTTIVIVFSCPICKAKGAIDTRLDVMQDQHSLLAEFTDSIESIDHEHDPLDLKIDYREDPKNL